MSCKLDDQQQNYWWIYVKVGTNSYNIACPSPLSSLFGINHCESGSKGEMSIRGQHVYKWYKMPPLIKKNRDSVFRSIIELKLVSTFLITQKFLIICLCSYSKVMVIFIKCYMSQVFLRDFSKVAPENSK